MEPYRRDIDEDADGRHGTDRPAESHADVLDGPAGPAHGPGVRPDGVAGPGTPGQNDHLDRRSGASGDRLVASGPASRADDGRPEEATSDFGRHGSPDAAPYPDDADQPTRPEGAAVTDDAPGAHRSDGTGGLADPDHTGETGDTDDTDDTDDTARHPRGAGDEPAGAHEPGRTDAGRLPAGYDGTAPSVTDLDHHDLDRDHTDRHDTDVPGADRYDSDRDVAGRDGTGLTDAGAGGVAAAPVPGATAAAPDAAGGAADDRARELQQRWREVQAGFVDDPRDAVQQADRLVEEAVAALTARRQALADRWNKADDNDTEQLRLALRDYRSMLQELAGLTYSPAGQVPSPARHQTR
ncbi:hypothetical protein Sru01_19960 [Sphaerisporangium rufum]|uniref:Uncharacterized protein n=1 Tax=Sphaerisporangium rufum TaxID=1381558 RepID=A0A919QZR0_9ACTN|nr:hypothetical protein [Sphaerisporangium rufum]GII77014.1 hypothetical protein Sru01_19960 [Sphaerisporangium rufum]